MISDFNMNFMDFSGDQNNNISHSYENGGFQFRALAWTFFQ